MVKRLKRDHDQIKFSNENTINAKWNKRHWEIRLLDNKERVFIVHALVIEWISIIQTVFCKYFDWDSILSS